MKFKPQIIRFEKIVPVGIIHKDGRIQKALIKTPIEVITLPIHSFPIFLN